METKNVTLRLPVELADELMRRYGSINQAVISELGYLKKIREVSTGEIKGLFSPEEWKFFYSVFFNTVIDSTFCANRGAFLAACDDAERFYGSASSLGVNFDMLTSRILSLKGANIEAIYNRIAEVKDECDLDTWSIF